jgi:cytochrome b561
MAPKSPPPGYSLVQILLHWIIAALIAFQILFHEGMEHAFNALNKGKEVNPADLASAQVHEYIGLAILALAVLRLIIRVARGAPAAPEGQSAIKTKVASATQHTLYLILFLMPVTGAAAWIGGISASAYVHQALVPLIFLLVLVHTAGALVQHFIAKTDVLVRIFRPKSAQTL